MVEGAALEELMMFTRVEKVRWVSELGLDGVSGGGRDAEASQCTDG